MINTYIVQKNESISDIAKKFDFSIEEFMEVNDSDLMNISEGDIINIPDKPDNPFVYYQVRKGDTLTSLSKKIGMSVSYFTQINGLSNDEYLYVGQILLIPKPGLKVYITSDVESLDEISKKLGITKENILKNNKNIYLSKEQLLLYK